MSFTQHYDMPVCAPSRYCLMTGINSGKAFIRGNDEWEERGDVWDFKAMEANPFVGRPVANPRLHYYHCQIIEEPMAIKQRL